MIRMNQASPGATFGKAFDIALVVEKADMIRSGQEKRLNVYEPGFRIGAFSDACP